MRLYLEMNAWMSEPTTQGSGRTRRNAQNLHMCSSVRTRSNDVEIQILSSSPDLAQKKCTPMFYTKTIRFHAAHIHTDALERRHSGFASDLLHYIRFLLILVWTLLHLNSLIHLPQICSRDDQRLWQSCYFNLGVWLVG